MHELAGPQSRHLRHHLGEQGIGGDVERHTEEDVGRARWYSWQEKPAARDVGWNRQWQGGNAILSMSAGFQAVTTRRRDQDCDGWSRPRSRSGRWSRRQAATGAVPSVDRPELAVLVRPFVPDRHRAG